MSGRHSTVPYSLSINIITPDSHQPSLMSGGYNQIAPDRSPSEMGVKYGQCLASEKSPGDYLIATRAYNSRKLIWRVANCQCAHLQKPDDMDTFVRKLSKLVGTTTLQIWGNKETTQKLVDVIIATLPVDPVQKEAKITEILEKIQKVLAELAKK